MGDDFGKSNVQRLFDDRTGLVTQAEPTEAGIGRGAVRHLHPCECRAWFR